MEFKWSCPLMIIEVVCKLTNDVYILHMCCLQEGLVEKFIEWTREAEEPLQSYATGLLARAIEVQEIAANFKEHNSQLVSEILILGGNNEI